MSRIGKKPVTIPKGVTASLNERTLLVKGPKGELTRTFHPDMALSVNADQVSVARPSDENRHKALHGLSRTLVQNMMDGVSKGFSKTLEIQGVGYKAEPKPYGVNLIVHKSNPRLAWAIDDGASTAIHGSLTSDEFPVDGSSGLT